MLRAALALALLSTAFLAGAAAQAAPGTCVEDLSIVADHDNAIVMLSWTATPGAAFYDIDLARDDGDSEHLATVPAGQTSFVHDPAPEGVLDYRVAADGHPSLDCPAASVHIGGTPIPPEEQVCVGGLTGEALPDGRIRIAWPGLPGATSYDILRSTTGGVPTPFAVRDGSVREFIDEDTTPGVAHTYAVSANGIPSEGERCEELTLVAVPFFGPMGIVLATLGAIGAFIAMRRR